MPELTGIKLPDYLVICVYFMLIIFVGYYFSRYIAMAKDFFCAGNVMPWWLGGTSFFMASFSTLLFVIYNEISYKYGFVAVTICWTGPVAMLLGGYFTAHRWRRARILTPISFMDRRYNKLVHQIFVWTGFPLRMFDNALKIYATAIMLMVAIQQKIVTFNRFVIIVGFIMIAYTFLGGQMAVMITDFIQAIILIVAVVMLFILCLQYVGDVGALVQQFPTDFLNLAHEPYDWSYIIFTALAMTILSYNASWALVQKYNCVRSEHDARKMIYFIALLMFITPPIFFFPGMIARVVMPDIADTRQIYAVISMKVLPVGLMGLILSAMLSATLSTLGSEYNTLSGVLTRDFYKKMMNPGASEKREVFFGRIATLVIGLATMLLALFYNSLKGMTLLDIMFRFFSAFGPPIMIPLILGLLFKRFNARGVIWGIVSGTTVGLILIIANIILIQKYAALMETDKRLDFWLRSGWNSAANMLNISVTVLTMWLGTITKETPREEKERVKRFFDDLETPYEIDATLKSAGSPFGIIGMTTALFGGAIMVIALIIGAFYHDMRACFLNLAVGVFLLLLGMVLKGAGRRKVA